MAVKPKLTRRASVTDAFGDVIAETRVRVQLTVPGSRPDEIGGYELLILSRDIAGARREVADFLKKYVLDAFFPPPAAPPA